jgi:hypothetical protein
MIAYTDHILSVYIETVKTNFIYTYKLIYKFCLVETYQPDSVLYELEGLII